MNAVAYLKLRLLLMFVLAAAPVLFLVGVGGYHLWDRGWSFISYWPMAACWLAAYLLAWYTTRNVRPGPKATRTPALEWWTERDRAAWEMVEQAVNQLQPIPPDEVTNLRYYANQTQQLAQKIAEVYVPGATDPFSHLTLPEILACGELVSHDLTRLVDDYVPGSHMLTMGDLSRISNTVRDVNKYYPWARNLYWAASAIVNPAAAMNVAAQIAVAKGALGPAQNKIKENVMLWLQTSFLKELGRHLIELNSGRLKIGAKRYLELKAASLNSEIVPVPTEPELASADSPSKPVKKLSQLDLTPPITVAVIGPVNAGKSSLVNALLRGQAAEVKATPQTAGQQTFTLNRPGQPMLNLIDTQGFGQEGATTEDIALASTVASRSELCLLVLPARSAARAPELEFLTHLHQAIAVTPQFKMPPVILVLNQVDLLRPASEWEPPYDIESGTRLKEVSIREAIEAVKTLFQAFPVTVVPVCSLPGKEFGIQDQLIAAILLKLGEARGVHFLRALSAEQNQEQLKKVVHQLKKLGGGVAEKIWKQLR